MGVVEVRGAQVRVRRLWVVALLLVVTLGLYYVVWYYRVNRELRDYGRALAHPNPLAVDLVRTMLAVTVGGLVVVPASISVARMFERIALAERLTGVRERLNSQVTLAVFVAVLVVFVVLTALWLAGVGQVVLLPLNLLALALLAAKLAYTQHHVNAIWRRASAHVEAA